MIFNLSEVVVLIFVTLLAEFFLSMNELILFLYFKAYDKYCIHLPIEPR